MSRDTRSHWNGSMNKSGDTRGCQITHGHSKDRIYNIWCDMKRRCRNPKNKRYNRYGGRGIDICSEWESFPSFYDWAMTTGYSDQLSIERIDIDKNYTPENCKWIPMSLQQRNTSRSRWITANGETHTLVEWSEITGISADVIKDRLIKLGWSEQEAVTIPVMRMGGKRWLL